MSTWGFPQNYCISLDFLKSPSLTRLRSVQYAVLALLCLHNFYTTEVSEMAGYLIVLDNGEPHPPPPEIWDDFESAEQAALQFLSQGYAVTIKDKNSGEDVWRPT